MFGTNLIGAVLHVMIIEMMDSKRFNEQWSICRFGFKKYWTCIWDIVLSYNLWTAQYKPDNLYTNGIIGCGKCA